MGGVLRDQGDLPGAQDAFAEVLAISRRLVLSDPGNAGWQRGLAIALVCLSRLETSPSLRLNRMKRLREATQIFDALDLLAPDHVGWREEQAFVSEELTTQESLHTGTGVQP